VADVKVKLGADNSGFERGLAQARRSVSNFAGSAAKTLAAAFAISSITRQFSRLSEQFDRIEKLSRRGLSTDFLQDLSQSAQLAGTDLEVAARGAALFAKEIGSATGPSAKVRQELEALGLSVSEISAMTPEKAFERLAIAIGGLSSDNARLAASQNILGRSGAELIALFDDMYQRGGLANAPKATEAAIKSMAAYNDEMTKVKTQIDAELLPVFAFLAKAFLNLVTVSKFAFENIGAAMANFAGLLNEVFSLIFQTLKNIITEPFTAIKKAISDLGKEIATRLMPIIKTMGDLISSALSLDISGAEAAMNKLPKLINDAISDIKPPEIDIKIIPDTQGVEDAMRNLVKGAGMVSLPELMPLFGGSAPGVRERTGTINATETQSQQAASRRLIPSVTTVSDSLQSIGGGGNAVIGMTQQQINVLRELRKIQVDQLAISKKIEENTAQTLNEGGLE
jgi:hypothetical protein